MAIDIASALLNYGVEKGFASLLLAIGNVVQYRAVQGLIKERNDANKQLVDVLQKEIEFNRRAVQ